MGRTPQRSLFITTLAFRQAYQLERAQDRSEDPATLQASRSRDAVARSRALLARTANLLGTENYGKSRQK